MCAGKLRALPHSTDREPPVSRDCAVRHGITSEFSPLVLILIFFAAVSLLTVEETG